MCDLFTAPDVYKILKHHSILYIGDSITRGMYKDMVWLCSPSQNQTLISRQAMVTKGEDSFLGDRLIDFKGLIQGRNYVEARDIYFQPNDMQVSFIFVTSCYSDYLVKILESYPTKFGSFPDVIVMNSTLWDVCRWGPDGIHKFKRNLESLMSLFKRLLPQYTQVIWATTPPVSTDIRGEALLMEELAFQKESMRFNIFEANKYAALEVAKNGYDVVDLHYFLMTQIHRRCSDGVHWNPEAVRMQTNILLTFFCLSRELPLPGNTPSAKQLNANPRYCTDTDDPLFEMAKAASNATTQLFLPG